MSKKIFVDYVEQMITISNAPQEALDYFEKTIKAKKVNKKELDKAETVKDAIVSYLQMNTGKQFDRTEIGNALYNMAEFSEEYLLNDKGTVAYNSITSFANQLTTEGFITKAEVKEGKTSKIKYSIQE
jgi:hypothetical protein